MPRLLLVDDNPSIHKIAETLLATSSIELVCVDSAAAALERVSQGEHFDVALVDTSMAGMDGWGLLARLREIPSTARIPIAMMAGVLDTVDPDRIQAAPIQGFLKKPVELRDLGDRIARLMETPVPFAEVSIPSLKVDSPFATMPATRLDELPEFRKKQAARAAEEEEDDLLELTEEDLYPEPAAVKTMAEPVEESLDLEELDLDNLRGLSIQPDGLPVLTSMETVSDPSEPTPPEGSWPTEAMDAVATLDRLPAPFNLEEPEPLPAVAFDDVELPDLGAPSEEIMDIASLSNLPEIEEIITAEQVTSPDVPLASLLEEPREEASFTPPLPPLEESLDWSDDSESMLTTVESAAPMQAIALPEEELDLLDVSVPELAPEPSALQLDLEEASPLLEDIENPEPEASREDLLESTLVEPPATAAERVPVAAKELLDAMMADPVLMDTLAKAVVARLGDQVLREIAWDVIPELAERLPRG